MRTGSCTVQQGLTAEATAMVKQAVTLAKRRGHAQVTPLHVANTMLAATNGLLRTACLQSHSHPLQCKALELCFNVALNRLPTSNSISSPILGTSQYSQCPSISNALVAAFKRAQAHQRRGSIETQQQPLLAVKIELEQLIISILDDPSVSRVMREAGFSSTQVKSNVEQAVSLEVCNSQNITTSSVSNKSKENNNNSNNLTHSQPKPASQVGENSGKITVVSSDPVRAEDIMCVIDNLANRRRKSTVIVGECSNSLEGVFRGVMDKVEKGDVNEALRDVKFSSLSLSDFGHVSRVEVEKQIEELKSLTKASFSKGLIMYVGDLKWLFEYRARNSSQQQGRNYYCPVEHMVMEIGKLIGLVAENNGRFWLIGVATFQTYMRCKNGYPSLETVWGLQPLTIPAGSLCLSLITDSNLQNESSNKKVDNGSSCVLLESGEEKQPNSFAEPSLSKFETIVPSLHSSICNSDSTTSSLPAWLQNYKTENRGFTINDQNCIQVVDLCKKWNSVCSSNNTQPYPAERTLTFSSISPSSSTSGFSYDHQKQYPNLHHDWLMVEPKQSQKEHRFWISESGNNPNEPTLRMYIPKLRDPKLPLPSSDPSSNPNSTSSTDVINAEYVSKFKELSSENLKTLCYALEKQVPWQKDRIPEIVSTLLQCRSGMLKRKENKERNSTEIKEETWLFFQGVDMAAKEKIARELAKLVFGSHGNLVSISLSSFSSSKSDSTDECSRNKRSRDERSCSFIERFGDAVSSNPHRVFLVEDIEQADYWSQLGFKRAIERGKVADSSGEEVTLSDAIIILSCENFGSRSRACSPPVKQKSNSEGSQEEKDNATLEDTSSPCLSLDLNISIDDGDESNMDLSGDGIGLLESVDRRIIFKIQEFWKE